MTMHGLWAWVAHVIWVQGDWWPWLVCSRVDASPYDALLNGGSDMAVRLGGARVGVDAVMETHRDGFSKG